MVFPVPNALIASLRQVYPQASLVSELLNIHDGLYLVRVSVTVDSLCLAQGLAAQAVLENAEDLATHRALEKLMLPTTGSPATSGPEPLARLATSPQIGPAGQPEAPVVFATLEPMPLASPPEAASIVSDPSPPGERLLSLEEIAVSPIDLSDIIAQTDVELQRLGWDTHQGREFLERSYGKRSRHDLSDEELLAFLLYLETQPSPPANPRLSPS
ncbi:MAG: hypothetical protein VKL98_08545 [Cyanobacteriota bacterium]|nr:hypothetical protein [Cyanobacteriota bacterium]